MASPGLGWLRKRSGHRDPPADVHNLAVLERPALQHDLADDVEHADKIRPEVSIKTVQRLVLMVSKTLPALGCCSAHETVSRHDARPLEAAEGIGRARGAGRPRPTGARDLAYRISFSGDRSVALKQTAGMAAASGPQSD
jgi:hypothetical protein